jgi:hypothetical protein
VPGIFSALSGPSLLPGRLFPTPRRATGPPTSASARDPGRTFFPPWIMSEWCRMMEKNGFKKPVRRLPNLGS